MNKKRMFVKTSYKNFKLPMRLIQFINSITPQAYVTIEFLNTDMKLTQEIDMEAPQNPYKFLKIEESTEIKTIINKLHELVNKTEFVRDQVYYKNSLISYPKIITEKSTRNIKSGILAMIAILSEKYELETPLFKKFNSKEISCSDTFQEYIEFKGFFETFDSSQKKVLKNILTTKQFFLKVFSELKNTMAPVFSSKPVEFKFFVEWLSKQEQEIIILFNSYIKFYK